jgi:hypothetical protein
MDSIRTKISSHLHSLPKEGDVTFTKPNETAPGRFSILCKNHYPTPSVFKVVCEAIEPNKMDVRFYPLPKLNETGGNVPVPTNVKDIYTQYFQPMQVQSRMANNAMMVG